MLDQVFRRAAVRERIVANPIGVVLQRYVSFLAARGHRGGPLHQYVFAAEHYGRWLRGRPIGRASVERFIGRHLPRCHCDKPAFCHVHTVRAALNRLLEMLGRTSLTPAGTSLADRLLRQYEDHLRRACGLSDSTVGYRLRYARALLGWLRLR